MILEYCRNPACSRGNKSFYVKENIRFFSTFSLI